MSLQLTALLIVVSNILFLSRLSIKIVTCLTDAVIIGIMLPITEIIAGTLIKLPFQIHVFISDNLRFLAKFIIPSHSVHRVCRCHLNSLTMCGWLLRYEHITAINDAFDVYILSIPNFVTYVNDNCLYLSIQAYASPRLSLQINILLWLFDDNVCCYLLYCCYIP